jgi:hypothetical protein
LIGPSREKFDSAVTTFGILAKDHLIDQNVFAARIRDLVASIIQRIARATREGSVCRRIRITGSDIGDHLRCELEEAGKPHHLDEVIVHAVTQEMLAQRSAAVIL